MGLTKSRAAAGAGVSLVGGLLGSAVMPADVAYAHEAVAAEGEDFAAVSADHWWVRMVDAECDGHFSRGWFNLKHPYQWRVYVPDCSDTGWIRAPDVVSEFRMCEEDIGCSDWKDA